MDPAEENQTSVGNFDAGLALHREVEVVEELSKIEHYLWKVLSVVMMRSDEENLYFLHEIGGNGAPDSMVSL